MSTQRTAILRTYPGPVVVWSVTLRGVTYRYSSYRDACDVASAHGGTVKVCRIKVGA